MPTWQGFSGRHEGGRDMGMQHARCKYFAAQAEEKQKGRAPMC